MHKRKGLIIRSRRAADRTGLGGFLWDGPTGTGDGPTATQLDFTTRPGPARRWRSPGRAGGGLRRGAGPERAATVRQGPAGPDEEIAPTIRRSRGPGQIERPDGDSPDSDPPAGVGVGEGLGRVARSAGIGHRPPASSGRRQVGFDGHKTY
jgi:hypothetical protein